MSETESLAAPAAGSNLPILSVGELSLALRTTVERAYPLVRVRGEISGIKRAASGHLYFTLKDQDAVIDAVCWRATAQRLATEPDDGMEVIAQGRITTYPGRSKYQIVIDAIELAGAGALLKLLEDRRRKLAEEGLFAEARKKPLPYIPAVIGIVTSLTGAVIRDILHRLADRFPRRVLVWPVQVQGENAARQVADAIAGFNRLQPGNEKVPRPDLLIVARGGGSLEDLWAFNEEIVVRAAAESAIPLISAIGHETDTTLIDFAADRRAPTPTAAAEMAVPVRLDLLAENRALGSRLYQCAMRRLDHDRRALGHLVSRRPDLARITEQKAQRLDDWSERLRNSLRVGLERKQTRLLHAVHRLPRPDGVLQRASERLQTETRHLRRCMEVRVREREGTLKRAVDLLRSYSYTNVLGRGFALVRDRGIPAQPVLSAKHARDQRDLTIEFGDGRVPVRVTDDDAGAAKATQEPGSHAKETARPTVAGAGRVHRGQGTLF
ncbi:MAG: exodeoxyribonuclease VII large subunit [Proteobacteria bacterium]|nr:exodeoxyribonuclease VII large subunit [Pseudomonadota bacterium]